MVCLEKNPYTKIPYQTSLKGHSQQSIMRKKLIKKNEKKKCTEIVSGLGVFYKIKDTSVSRNQ